MGLLDGLAGQVLGSVLGDGQQQGGQAPGGALLQIAMNLLQNQPGGLAGLLQQFQQAGLGEAAASWVGTGQNAAIDGNQLSTALGADTIDGIANQLGIPQQEAAGGLAALLPQLIDQLTPQGRLPDDNALSGGLADLASKLLRG
ncbi:YidB family protein [Aromatoleum evansii]|uniref:YidB family protein n=1 Tax=Aromatoleum evansii TaxID=59406 RepID=UPI00145F38DA|nr:YidB family protein [Aromatoleum evansii]NMG28802.1 DUF937 domain-containing protein [Aromatoleum evansii]